MPGYALNQPRWRNRTGSHIESFFLKANDPHSACAVWLKVTCLQKPASTHAPSEQWLDLWCCVFDKSTHVYEGARQRFDLGSLSLNDGVLSIQSDTISIEFGADSGHFRTHIEGENSCIDVDLKWKADTSPLGCGYTMFPFSWMLGGPIPKQKTITPIGLCHVDGHVVNDGGRHQVVQWVGCQGHNWGRAHTPDYVWLQTVLFDETGIVGTCEAFSGSVRLGSTQLGPFSGLVLRLVDKTYRFDRLIDTWNHRVQFAEGVYELELSKGQLHILLRAKANLEGVVCLGYEDPDSTMHYCMNSKLADIVIELTDGTELQTFRSSQCVALEWLSSHPQVPVI